MKAREFWYDKLEFCGCARPGEVLLDIRDYLKISSEFGSERDPQYKRREKRFGSSYGYFLGYLMAKYGLTEHGGSVNTVWLSKDGLELLSQLENYEDDDIDEALEEE